MCIRDSCNCTFRIVSGGNSANLTWALAPGATIGGINHLRLGEALLLGSDPTTGDALAGLRNDAFALVGEVIESKLKPSRPWGERGRTSFDRSLEQEIICTDGCNTGGEYRNTVLVALGHQDTDPQGITPPSGFRVLGASSDHLVVEALGEPPPVGSELRFELSYSALLRSMTSPFVSKEYLRQYGRTDSNLDGCFRSSDRPHYTADTMKGTTS